MNNESVEAAYEDGKRVKVTGEPYEVEFSDSPVTLAFWDGYYGRPLSQAWHRRLIPKEAIEAAAEAVLISKLTGARWKDVPGWKKEGLLDEARAALEAAAPYMNQ